MQCLVTCSWKYFKVSKTAHSRKEEYTNNISSESVHCCSRPYRLLKSQKDSWIPFQDWKIKFEFFVSKTHLTSENTPISRMDLYLSKPGSIENKSRRGVFTDQFLHCFFILFCNPVNRYKLRNSLNRHAHTPIKDNPCHGHCNTATKHLVRTIVLILCK